MKLFLSIVFLFTALMSYAVKPVKEYSVLPEKYALIYKNLKVVTTDGLKIKTWFFPAQDSISKDEWYKAWENPTHKEYKTKYDSPRPTIIICNGDAQNMSYLIQYAKEFVGYGYNVVTFDWRGFGKSGEGQWETNEDYIVYTEYLLDYDAIVKEVLKQKEVDKTKIGLYGFSTGAYLSFATFYNHPEIKAFAGRGLMTDFKTTIDNVKEVDPGQIMIIPNDYPQNLMPIKIAPEIDRPCFLIVGEFDRRTPVSMSIAIFNKLEGEKQIWVVDNATHGGKNGPDFMNFKKFTTQLRTFYDLNLNY